MHRNLPAPAVVNDVAPALSTASSQRAGQLIPWLVLATFGLLALRLGAPSGSPLIPALGFAALSLAPLVAAIGCAVAARAPHTRASTSWYVLAGGAVVAVVGQVWWSLHHLAGAMTGSALTSALPFLIFHVFFAAAAAVALRQPKTHEPAPELALDVAILAVAGLTLVLRYGVEGGAGAPLDGGALLAAAGAPVTTFGVLFFAGLLLVWRGGEIGARAALPLALCAVAFSAGSLFLAVAPRFAAVGGGAPLDIAWLAGWALLAFAGRDARHPPADARVERAANRLGVHLRRAAVPMAVTALAVLAVDAMAGGRVLRATGFGVGALGILLVLRTHVALGAAARQAEEKRQLVHTRALVEVSRALAGATEVDRTLNLVAQWACRLLDARAAEIELLSEDGEHLEMRAAWGFSSTAIGMRFAVDASFTGWVVRNRRERVTDDPATDPLVQPQSLAHLGHSPTASVPLQYGDHSLGALSCVRERPFEPDDVVLLRALADQAAIAIETAQLFEQVRSLSLTDPLTGLANRRQLERDMARELAAARRGRKVAIVLFDLDDFKPYNDRHGHLAGDEALRVFGAILRVETRAMNLAARYGGDEFVVLLSDSEAAGAQKFAERVRQRFHDEVQGLGFGTLGVSYGVAEYTPETADANDFFAAADRDLYDSKGAKASR